MNLVQSTQMHISLKHLRCNWLRTELDNIIYSHVVLMGESSVQTVKILVILYVYFSWSVLFFCLDYLAKT